MATLRLGVISAAICSAALAATAASPSAALADVGIRIEPDRPLVKRKTTFEAQLDSATRSQVAPDGYAWSVRSGGGWTALADHGREASYSFTRAGVTGVRLVVTFRAGEDGKTPDPITRQRIFLVFARLPATPSPPQPPRPSPKPPPPAVGPGANRPPAAFIKFFPSVPHPYETVELISVARDPDGSIVQEKWDLDGDGAFDDASGSVVTHRFLTPGLRLVSLRVVDSRGATATAFVAVDVRPRTIVPRLLSPFPLVRLQGRVVARGVRITLLLVRAGRGAIVRVRCDGRSCPYPRRRASVSRSQRMRMRRLERFLRAGTRIEVRVTKPGRIGKYTRFRIRRGSAPARVDRCIAHTASRPRPCPVN